ncbi:MAG: hypothetical protein GY862_34360 [Gammaproteobacteria bacterium]|nr:hypothetical protein [Gammaproteobacteria bacterium]
MALFSSRRYLQRRDGVLSPEKGKGRREWVISRGLCHYRLFSLTDIPPARRDQALQIKIRQWSPFSKHASYCVWQGGKALVWLWNHERQAEAVKETGVKQVHILPEPVLRPRPADDSIQLLQCLDGIEGQIWQGRRLQGSRWWPQPPNPLEWGRFLRAHSLPIGETMPEITESPLLPRPWGRPKSAFGGGFLRQERLWVFLGAGVFAAALAWQGVSNWKLQQALEQVQSRIEALDERATPILETRTEAIASKQAIKRLQGLTPYPSQLELFALVAEKLPGSKAQVVRWFYQTGRLELTIEAPNINQSFYVKTFQKHPFFQDIEPDTGRSDKQIILKINLPRAN